VSIQKKYVAFRGIEKKEQILFKSFLNLAKNELSYQAVILKDKDEEKPDIVIADSSFELSGQESGLEGLPNIVIGNDINEERSGYIVRPVQWSDFKVELTRLETELQSEDDVDSPARILPDEMEFVIAEMDDQSESISESTAEDQASDNEEYDYELANMSIDYQSFTNSEYMKVVDDVHGFKDDEKSIEPAKAVLTTDEESASRNSVLVIETNSLDAWEMSEAEFEAAAAGPHDDDDEDSEQDDLDEVSETEIDKKLNAGTPVNPGDEYWKYDLEIFTGRESLLFIKAERDMVYSQHEPAKWPNALSKEQVVKHPLDKGWRPTEGLKAYSLNRLRWANTLATNNNALNSGLNDNTEYMLQRWPDFELLELDNVLLKLCTLLFVGPESAYSLMQKSGYGRNAVFGLLNACSESGILCEADEVQLESFSEASNEDGVFGKIKDVFR